MPVVSHVKLMVTIPTDVAQRVVETWARSIKDEAPDIYAKILARIPDEKRFVERLAQPSHNGFASFVNPSFVSKSGLPEPVIQYSQASNIKRSYEKYVTKLQHLFETVDGIPAKRFKELADRMKNAYGSGATARSLPFTGTKIEGRGCAPIAAFWLVKDLRVADYLRAGDQVLEGGPYLVTFADRVPAFKAMLNQRLIQAGANIVKSDYNATSITANNNHTNALLQSFVDPALGLVAFATGAASHVDYIMEDGQLFLDVMVSQM